MSESEDFDSTPVAGLGIVYEGTKLIHYTHSRTAVDKAKLCPIDTTRPNPPPRVAIVLADGERMIGWAAKGHGGEVVVNAKSRVFDVTPAEHAEEALLRELADTELSNATAYITLEPCTSRNKGRPCVDLLIARGIRTVFVGNSDPHPDINKGAWRSFLPQGFGYWISHPSFATKPGVITRPSSTSSQLPLRLAARAHSTTRRAIECSANPEAIPHSLE